MTRSMTRSTTRSTTRSLTPTIRTALAATLLALCAGCKGETKMAPLDLSGAGTNATVTAPEGATVAAGKFGGTTISHGKEYVLTIRPKAEDLKRSRDACTGAEYKNCEIVSDADDAVITKWVQLSKDVHQVTANVQAGGTTYGCSSESAAGVAVPRDVADLMVKTCKSIAPK